MIEMLSTLIGIALVQFICIHLSEEPKQKALLRFAGGVAMAAVLLGKVLTFDYSAYASSLRALQNRNEIIDSAQAENHRLNRMFIEQECSAYIMDKAASLGVELSEVSVSLSWNTAGYWYPSAVSLTVKSPCDYRKTMEDWMQTALGIPVSSQMWREEEPDEP